MWPFSRANQIGFFLFAHGALPIVFTEFFAVTLDCWIWSLKITLTIKQKSNRLLVHENYINYIFSVNEFQKLKQTKNKNILFWKSNFLSKFHVGFYLISPAGLFFPWNKVYKMGVKINFKIRTKNYAADLKITFS